MGAIVNVLVEFEKKIKLGAFILKIGGIFFKLGSMGANVLVEFEKKILTGGIFFLNWGQKLFWDRENQLFWELY